MALSPRSWLNVSLLDLLSVAPGLNREEVKDALYEDDDRLQLDLNPLAGEDRKKITLLVNSSLNLMGKAKVKGDEKYVNKTRGDVPGLDPPRVVDYAVPLGGPRRTLWMARRSA